MECGIYLSFMCSEISDLFGYKDWLTDFVILTFGFWRYHNLAIKLISFFVISYPYLSLDYETFCFLSDQDLFQLKPQRYIAEGRFPAKSEYKIVDIIKVILKK